MRGGENTPDSWWIGFRGRSYSFGSFAQVGFDVAGLSDIPRTEILRAFFEQLLAIWDRPRPRLITREAGFERVPISLQRIVSGSFPHPALGERRCARGDVPAVHLIWEPTTPLAAIPILRQNAQSSPEKHKEGLRLARANLSMKNIPNRTMAGATASFAMTERWRTNRQRESPARRRQVVAVPIPALAIPRARRPRGLIRSPWMPPSFMSTTSPMLPRATVSHVSLGPCT